MNPMLQNLARLAELRQREVDRRLAEVADKQSVRARYQRNLDQLDALSQGVGASARAGAAAPGAALNSAQYKQTVQQLALAHRDDLARHDAGLDAARQALAEASRQREVLQQLLARQRQAVARAQAAREQKRQDDLATQVWLRRRPA